MIEVFCRILSERIKTIAINKEPASARKFPMELAPQRPSHFQLIIMIPKKATRIPQKIFIDTFLFKNTVSMKTVKTGARVPKRVALAMDVSFTAEKKQAK